MHRFIAAGFLILFFTRFLLSQEIVLNKNDAEVWSTEQLIIGKLDSFLSADGILYLNGNPIHFDINQSDSTFEVQVKIEEGLNIIFVEVDNDSSIITSDTLQLTLAFKIEHEVYAYAEISGSNINLLSSVIANPKNEAMNFFWSADIDNPAVINISSPNDSITSAAFNSEAMNGEYYFDLVTISASNDTVKTRTFFTVYSDSMKAFDIKNDYAAWIDTAVIYEITPYIFVINGELRDIINKIPEFVRLGVNTIWIQPIFGSHYGGQGYDIINYFEVRSDYGDENDLRELIAAAHANGLKVLLDFVANHSSIQHPYALNSSEYGISSHYWNFYQREEDNAPYSQHYSRHNGFINYFWAELPNLNYNNPEVRKWITEAAKYWIEEFDIDGYRFDAIWGTTARNPQFTKDLRLALKRIKPEVLLLGEDKATQPQVFDERFDVAYDWFPEESWVSHWVFQTDYNPNANPTVFNYSVQNQRSNLLRDALTNNGSGYVQDARILRFLGNNDIFPFIKHHGLARTKMATALIFALNGIPLIYNGQEIGFSEHPYETEFIFYPGRDLDYDDDQGLFKYHQKLIEYKKTLPALYGKNYDEISITPSLYMFAFRRWEKDQNIFTVLNMGSAGNAAVTIPVAQLDLDTSKTYYLTDLIGGEVISGKLSELTNFNTNMDLFSAKIFMLADSIVNVVGIGEEEIAQVIPKKFELNQNYPNPFNPSTKIQFSIPFSVSNTNPFVQLKIYDILGNEVATLVSENLSAGNYEYEFDGSRLASGIYLYRIQYDKKMLTKKMILLK